MIVAALLEADANPNFVLQVHVVYVFVALVKIYISSSRTKSIQHFVVLVFQSLLHIHGVCVCVCV